MGVDAACVGACDFFFFFANWPRAVGSLVDGIRLVAPPAGCVFTAKAGAGVSILISGGGEE